MAVATGKYLYWTLAAMVIVILVVLGVYSIIDAIPADIADVNLTSRGIDTPLKKALNGHLGVFFRFKLLGNINWLMLPILVHFLITIKKRERWEKALVFLYLLSVILIALQGYFNHRYAQTLLVVTIAMVLFSLWRFFSEEVVRKLRHPVMLFCLLLVAFNTYHYMPWGGHAGRTDIASAFNLDEAPLVNAYEGAPKMSLLGIFGSAVTFKEVADLRSNRDMYMGRPKSTAGVVEFVDGLELQAGRYILTNHLYLVYYYTDHPARYYWAEDDVYYTGEGLKPWLKDATLEEQRRILQNEMQCDYILTRNIYNTYNPDFNAFLENTCTLIYRDAAGYEVYQPNNQKHGSL